MKLFILRLASTLGVVVIVVLALSLPLFFIKSDAGQTTYIWYLLWVSMAVHMIRFMEWLWKDKEDKK